MTLDSTAKIKAFYGEPGEANLVTAEFPYPMYYDGKLAKKFRCHRLVKDRIISALSQVLKEYGLQKIKELGLDQFGGCFNYRLMRGGSSLSTHAWGIALDFDPANNHLKWNHRKARFAQPEYVRWWEIWEENGFESLGREEDRDWMHVQAKH
jgi:hypothetical protein